MSNPKNPLIEMLIEEIRHLNVEAVSNILKSNPNLLQQNGNVSIASYELNSVQSSSNAQVSEYITVPSHDESYSP
jgi:hypothetical protein